jgi:hypothetical protein
MSLVEPLSVDARVEELARPEFWKAHFPKLSINDRLACWNKATKKLSTQTRDLYSARMREEGYFQDRNDTLERLAPVLARAVKTCNELDIPPTFIFLFNEAWECFYALRPMLAHFLGEDYKALPDFWAWHVDPQAGEAGWRPHRDKGKFSLSADGAPLSLTVWVPLLEATPQNSCIYLLPANRDPVYNTEDEKNWRVELNDIRALPAKPGDFICWNQAILHWGSATSRFAAHPRISMALEFQRGDRAPFNIPLIDALGGLSFSQRLCLVGKQILQYKHMYPLAARFQQLAERLLAST